MAKLVYFVQILCLSSLLQLPRASAISRQQHGLLHTGRFRGSVLSRMSLQQKALGHHFAPPNASETLIPSSDTSADVYAWLEDVTGAEAMSWVRSENQRTLAALGDPTASPLFTRVRSILESKQRIPFVASIGDHLYNFWTDKDHIRGVWRRTTLQEYRKADPQWETVLDLDALGKSEGESWVWKHYAILREGPGKLQDLALLHLSRGGADATVVREFNLTSKQFLPAPLGFVLPEAKCDVSYLDRNTLLVGSDFGKGSMTSSGYPRIVRKWVRGSDLKKAPVFFEGQSSDVSVDAHRQYDRRGCIYDFRGRATSFWTRQNFVRIVAGPGASSSFSQLEIPDDAGASTFATELILSTRSQFAPAAGVSFPAGSLLAMPLVEFLKGERVQWTQLFIPDDNKTLVGFAATQDYIVLRVLNAVKPELIVWRFAGDGHWQSETASAAVQRPNLKIASINAWPFDPEGSNALWVTEDGFLRPTTLSLADSAAHPEDTEKLKSLPEMFSTAGLSVSQRWATSQDGTRVPYFLVSRAETSGDQPTLLYGYGGFRIPQLPFYSASIGALWLERGGAFALANIRGGGEFGPRWHEAATKGNKHKSFEDFAAVAEHLVSTGVTSPSRLSIMGGSNGGFLVGNMLVKYPRLFGAAVCQVPLLDMKRYNKLLAGASWMAEYGNPDDPHDWNFLRHNSPYHNLHNGTHYPPVLFITSTRDDRVHPSHARKMAAKMQSLGLNVANHTFLYENMEGGHGAAADTNQSAMVATLEYDFLWRTLHGKN